LHREFLRAGAEVLQTMTFYASDDKLATVGLAGKVDEINRDAVGIARTVAAEGDALVAGNLSLTWAYDPSDPKSADHVRALFDRQLRDQLDAGPPDFWIGETFSYTGEALLFVERAKATGLPVMATMCFERLPARSYEGDTPGESAKRLADAGADIVGVNCLNGPSSSSRSPSRWWTRSPVLSRSRHSPLATRRRMTRRISPPGPTSRTGSPRRPSLAQS
jgi:betaine-homocysteine S-methyltransferase